MPRFSFDLNVGTVVVGSQLGLHDNRTSSLSFRAEGGEGLHFALNTDLTPGWGNELVGLKTHATLSNPGVCHEQVEVVMFIQMTPTRPGDGRRFRAG